MDDRLITVAIHTYDRAQELKNLLEHEGLDVSLQNVNLESPVVSSGIRVRINESDLPFALRIIENQDVFATKNNYETKTIPHILVPVDFSLHSEKACFVAIKLAAKLKSRVHILHSYTIPSSGNITQLSDVLSFDTQPNDNADTRRAIESECSRQMDILNSTLLKKMKNGELPAVKYNTEITEGIPEEAINQHTKIQKPLMIVMGTRSSNTSERELLGSITAEVLDTCRFPVFTIPYSTELDKISVCKNIIFFCNIDQDDILALDALFRLLPVNNVNVTLVRIISKKRAENEVSEKSIHKLKDYCTQHYSKHCFNIDAVTSNSIDEDLNRLASTTEGNIICIPNKSKNIFARLFNPGIAHKLLFHTDIPMMVIPV